MSQDPKVRGGFSPLVGGWGGHGLGDDSGDVTDPSQMMNGPFVSLANPALQIAGSGGTSGTLAGVPIWAWLAGGVLALTILMPKR